MFVAINRNSYDKLCTASGTIYHARIIRSENGLIDLDFSVMNCNFFSAD